MTTVSKKSVNTQIPCAMPDHDPVDIQYCPPTPQSACMKYWIKTTIQLNQSVSPPRYEKTKKQKQQILIFPLLPPKSAPQYSIVQPGGYSQLYHRAPEKRSKSDQTEPQNRASAHHTLRAKIHENTPNWIKNWVKQHWYHTRLSKHPIGALPKSTEAPAM